MQNRHIPNGSDECGDFAQVRNNCFHVDNMKELFQDIHIGSIMTFLRQINGSTFTVAVVTKMEAKMG